MSVDSRNRLLGLAAPGVAGLAPYQPGKPAAELEREYGIRNAVKLASNENPAGPSPAVRAALRDAVSGIERYPDGAAFSLRDALSTHLQVQPQQLTMGNGSNDVLVLLAETFLTADHAAIYDQYSFVVYRLAVQACGAEARVAPSQSAEGSQPLGHDLNAMKQLVDERARLVFIANPNNPTGTWLGQGELKQFIADMPAHVIVVLDEAYIEYSQQPGDENTLDWLQEFSNLVIVRTFSKAYALAGLRVGYCISSAAIADLLNRVRQPFNVNTLAQSAAVAALGDQAWISTGVAQNASERARLQAELAALELRAIPSRGNFVLVDFISAERAAAANDYLLHRGVIVRPVANYGLAQHLRITVGAPAENDRVLTELKSFTDGG